MVGQNDDFDNDDEIESSQTKISRRKILFILLPLLAAIGLFVGFYYVFNRSYDNGAGLNYSVVKNSVDQESGAAESFTVFYDLPEIVSRLKNQAGLEENFKLKISIELSRVEDVQAIENILPRITDAVLAHTTELNASEIEGSNGIYWLKEELLYRINLLTSPVKVTSLNFKNFEVQKMN